MVVELSGELDGADNDEKVAVGAALALGEAPCCAPIAWRTVSVGSIF